MASPVLESVGAGAAEYNGSTPLPVPYPSGIAENDYLVMGIWLRNYIAVTTPANWELITYMTTSNIRFSLFGGYAAGTETGNLDVAYTSACAPIIGAMARFSGVHLTRPYESLAEVSMTNTTTMTIASVAAYWHERLFVAWLFSNSAITLNDNGTYYGEDIDFNYNGSQDGSLGMYTYTKATEGAVSDAVTMSATAFRGTAAIALRPLAAPAPNKLTIGGVDITTIKDHVGVDPSRIAKVGGSDGIPD